MRRPLKLICKPVFLSLYSYLAKGLPSPLLLEKVPFGNWSCSQADWQSRRLCKGLPPQLCSLSHSLAHSLFLQMPQGNRQSKLETAPKIRKQRCACSQGFCSTPTAQVTSAQRTPEILVKGNLHLWCQTYLLSLRSFSLKLPWNGTKLHHHYSPYVKERKVFWITTQTRAIAMDSYIRHTLSLYICISQEQQAAYL